VASGHAKTSKGTKIPVKKGKVKSVIWGEWKQYRLFLLLILLLVLVTRILVSSLFIDENDETFYRFFIGHLFFSLFFALFLGAIPFGNKLSGKDEFTVDAVPLWQTFCLRFFFGTVRLFTN